MMMMMMRSNRSFSTLSRISQEVAKRSNAKPKAVPITNATRRFVPLTSEQNKFLDEVIRVDQAGELGANYIYQGQMMALLSKNPALKPVLTHMWEQELHHHDTFNKLVVKHRVRPSLLTPLWKVGAVAMGYVTGSISKEAAMACTVAVETVIGGHYNAQLRTLINDFSNIDLKNLESGAVHKNEAGLIAQDIEDLKNKIKLFRDQELEHLDVAIEHDAESAVPYWLITDVIKMICRISIFTAERI